MKEDSVCKILEKIELNRVSLFILGLIEAF